MGEAYLAQDTRRDRKVALKILPADLAANEDRTCRFVLEAKAAAALNHPNIELTHRPPTSPSDTQFRQCMRGMRCMHVDFSRALL
jgi:serine/threonine protein kinase